MYIEIKIVTEIIYTAWYHLYVGDTKWNEVDDDT